MKRVSLTAVFVLMMIWTGFKSADVLSSDSTEPSSKKPNIILIMADDMGYETLGTYGSASYKTPNLDSMADRGVKFINVHSQPLCTPSRVKIMTGKYNFRNYTDFGYLSPDETTFGNIFQDAGYHTLIAGKWQLNGHYEYKQPGWDNPYRPHHFGFDEYILWQVTKGANQGERYANPLLYQNGKPLPRDKDAYGPDLFVDYIFDFIDRKKDAENPFLIYYPMVLPHNPFVPTPDSPEWEDPTRRYEDENRYFGDMVTYIDKIVGSIEKKLVQEGLIENTLFIFTADNGTNRRIVSEMKDGAEVSGKKGFMVDWGTKVPMIAYWKGQSLEGHVSEDLVDFSDVLPTLLDAADIPAPANKIIDGQSFLPVLKGEPHFRKEYIYMYYKPDWGGDYLQGNSGVYARTETYKLYGDGRFYNAYRDVQETEDLSGSGISSDLLELRRKLQNVLDQKPGVTK